jgi:hypothetical protein
LVAADDLDLGVGRDMPDLFVVVGAVRVHAVDVMEVQLEWMLKPSLTYTVDADPGFAWHLVQLHDPSCL